MNAALAACAVALTSRLVECAAPISLLLDAAENVAMAASPRV
jgi:hypothetical protein